jgi:hypothetical protein
MYAVAKPFQTLNRRFNVDDQIAPSDIVESNHLSFSDLKEGGFIKGKRMDYSAMSKADLESVASECGVGVSGAKTKTDLAARLQHAEKVKEALAIDDLDALFKADLERLATERGLDITQAKTKAELIALLRAGPAVSAVPTPPSTD